MEQEIIKLSPDRLGYKDRGLMKWQGMILSDHTEALKKINKDLLESVVAEKEEMTIESISKVLYQAYATKKPVIIQASILKDGNYYPDVTAYVLGFTMEKIILQVRKKDGSEIIKKITLDMIRNIELLDLLKWNKKNNNNIQVKQT